MRQGDKCKDRNRGTHRRETETKGELERDKVWLALDASLARKGPEFHSQSHKNRKKHTVKEKKREADGDKDKDRSRQRDKYTGRQKQLESAGRARRVMGQTGKVWVIPLSNLIITKGPSRD